MPAEVKKQMVVDAYQDIVIAQGIKWVDKRSDDFQKLIGQVLELLGIQEAEMYEQKFLTMLPLPIIGSIFATPFTPGEATEDYPLDAQLDVLPHEDTHFLDATKEGLVVYGLEYAARKTGRVHREMRANASMAEWGRARGNNVLDPVWWASQMRFYGCAAEVPFTELELRSMLRTANAGGVVEGLGGEQMIRWALRKYPELIVVNPMMDAA